MAEGVGACEFANLRRHWLEKAGRLIRPRGNSGLRRTHPLCAVSSSSPGLRIQGPGLQNPRGHGLPCAGPGRTVGSSGGLTQSGGCSKRRSIPATVPAAPTPLARSAPPARCPGPISGTIYHVPLLRSPTTTPEPLPLLPLCPTALYHAMLWYTPSMRTRVPSFGQTFPLSLINSLTSGKKIWSLSKYPLPGEQSVSVQAQHRRVWPCPLALSGCWAPVCVPPTHSRASAELRRPPTRRTTPGRHG